MTRYEIIQEVKRIILQFAKPEQIILYGSSASGEYTDTSDIDIAYSDADYRCSTEILAEVEKLRTLYKIDVVNIAFSEERFRNRVKSTGIVIYSGTKKLRFEDAYYNFSKALARFKDVCNRKSEINELGLSDIYLDLIVKRFEFTYEMSWKAIKRYLDFAGISVKNPRESYKEAFAQGLIKEQNTWLVMIEQRNLSSHVYNEAEIAIIFDKIEQYLSSFEELSNSLKAKIE